jgi:hypothetical protein
MPPPEVCADAMVIPVTRAAAAVVTRNEFLSVFLIGDVSLLNLPGADRQQRANRQDGSDPNPAESRRFMQNLADFAEKRRFKRLEPSEQREDDHDD